MAKEISGTASSGTLYARLKNASGQWWNGSAFETYSAANWSTYVIAMTEEGSSNVYFATFPSGITSSGTYEYFVHRSVSGTPIEGDVVVNTGKVDWTGSVSVSASTGAMTATDYYAYVLRQGFKRTDKSTEFYECVTDAIQEMRRRFMFDEAGADTTTTDTISVLGDFKISLETDHGLLLGVTVQDGTDADPLTIIPKFLFDRIYPDINVTSDKGYPSHACVYAGSIYIGPVPDSVSYTYRLSYSKRAGTVSASTTGVPFTDYYRDILTDNVMARLYKMLEEWDNEARYRQKFEEGFFYATRKERINNGETCFAVRPFGC